MVLSHCHPTFLLISVLCEIHSQELCLLQSDIVEKAAVKAVFVCSAESRPGVKQMKILPVLHAGGERIHTGSDGTNGETGLDNRVRVEKNGLHHIQNICVSVYVGKNIYKCLSSPTLIKKGKLIHS